MFLHLHTSESPGVLRGREKNVCEKVCFWNPITTNFSLWSSPRKASWGTSPKGRERELEHAVYTISPLSDTPSGQQFSLDLGALDSLLPPPLLFISEKDVIVIKNAPQEGVKNYSNRAAGGGAQATGGTGLKVCNCRQKQAPGGSEKL